MATLATNCFRTRGIRLLVTWLFIAIHAGALAHELDNDHGPGDIDCKLCVVSDKIDDTLTAVVMPSGAFTPCAIAPSVVAAAATPARAIVATSRAPPGRI